MAELVDFKTGKPVGVSTTGEKEQDNDVVSVLAQLLEVAKSGDIAFLAIAGLTRKGEYITAAASLGLTTRPAEIGTIAILQHKFLRTVEKE